MIKRAMVALSLLFWMTVPAWAVKMQNLYQVDLPVMTQLEDSRNEAATVGLLQVLVRLTGNDDIAQNREIKENLQRAAYYVADYSYLQPSASASSYFIRINYEKSGIERLLKNAGLSYWGEDRPLILTWLLFDNGKENDIISNENDTRVASDMKTFGHQYGLPIIFPTMVVRDMELVSSADILSTNLATLKTAAKRYQPEVLLIGTLKKGVENWTGNWKLVTIDNEWSFNLKSVQYNMLLNELFAKINKILAKQYMANLTGQPLLWIKLNIAHVQNSEDLSELMAFLNQNKHIQKVEMKEIMADTVTISVLINGRFAAFQKDKTLLSRLKLVAVDQSKNTLSYDWE